MTRMSIMPRDFAQHSSEGWNRRESKGNCGTLELFSDPKSRLWFQTIILFSSVNRKLFLLFYRSMPSLHMVYTCDVGPHTQPVCFWRNYLTTLQCCRDVGVLRPKYCSDVKSAWRTLRVPPALYHCCVGLASCLLRGFGSATCNDCARPRVTQTFCSVALAEYEQVCFVCLGISIHLSCGVSLGLSPWLCDHKPPKPFLNPSETWEFV